MQRLLVIQGRGFGDALIAARFLSALTRTRAFREVDVITKPEFAGLFREVERVRVVATARFPMATGGIRNPFLLFPLFQAVNRARAARYEFGFNYFPDFRERLLFRCVAPELHFEASWPPGHPFARLSRRGYVAPPRNTRELPVTEINVYRILAELGRQLTAEFPVDVLLETVPRSIKAQAVPRIVLHPFARGAYRQWQEDNWRDLARHLITRGFEVFACSAPNERGKLSDIFSAEVPEVKLHAASLTEFLALLRSANVLVCVDSFPLHAGAYTGTPTVLLNGANDWRVWSPTPHVASAGGQCPNYPCISRPKCQGSSIEFVCVRGISVTSVLALLDDALSAKENLPRPAACL
jgi:heptosyltransferase-3